MTTIILQTVINAPIARCFDLSRSLDLHQASMSDSGEKAIAGRTSGLIQSGETVTWQATHFFIRQKLTTKIVDMRKPTFFRDVMIDGAFRSMEHDHTFIEDRQTTTMIDRFTYEVPFGIIGRIFDTLVLKKYMTNLLVNRNNVIKDTAESD